MGPKVAGGIILSLFFVFLIYWFKTSNMTTFKYRQDYHVGHRSKEPPGETAEIKGGNKTISSETHEDWNRRRPDEVLANYTGVVDGAEAFLKTSSAVGTNDTHNVVNGEPLAWSNPNIAHNRNMINFTDVADTASATSTSTKPVALGGAHDGSNTNMTNFTDEVNTAWDMKNATSDAEKATVILAWNSFFGLRDFGAGGLGKTAFVTCPISNCILTDDHAYLLESSALLFHIREAATLPSYRDERQLYVFFLKESPVYSTSHFNCDYNLTMTYRLDSDIAIPYGEVYRKPSAESPYQLNFPFANRTRSVAWIVSNCGTASKRERYVEKLKRYIDVDVYGACGSMPGCGRNEDSDCRQKIASKYKFYLSFENSLCQDYVTEKLFRALSTEIVPIVYGGTNYSRDAPPHSVINVEDYSSPKELARYLRRLASNETEYNAYFEWKSIYGIRENSEVLRRGFCKLCEIVNTPSFHKTYANMALWWSIGKCKAPLLS